MPSTTYRHALPVPLGPTASPIRWTGQTPPLGFPSIAFSQSPTPNVSRSFFDSSPGRKSKPRFTTEKLGTSVVSLPETSFLKKNRRPAALRKQGALKMASLQAISPAVGLPLQTGLHLLRPRNARTHRQTPALPVLSITMTGSTLMEFTSTGTSFRERALQSQTVLRALESAHG